ncbi:MAG: alginate lyase family protein [Flavobacteriaceae bacterium]
MKKSQKSTKKNYQGRLGWYLKRLGTMSFAEMVYRAKTAIKKSLDKRRKDSLSPAGKLGALPQPILHLPKIEQELTLSEYSIFGHPLKIDANINWHLDIMNNKEFPKLFSFSIDTRTGKYGNVKVVWEINRLQFLSAICLQYQKSKDTRHLDQFMEIITSWKEANPYLEGVNWYSNIEVNIRIINWFLCWELLEVNKILPHNERFRRFVEQVWLPLIELHGIHASRYESQHSSANNHLIAEGCGLFVLGSYWSFKEAPKWRAKGKAILEREIEKQHSSNGINKEEASEYIQFITDFFLIAYLVGSRTGAKFTKSYVDSLKTIFEYIYQLMDISGKVPYYGDDDDGKLFWLNTDTSNNFQSLLCSGALLFNSDKFKAKAKRFDVKNQIFFGAKGQHSFTEIPFYQPIPETKIYEKEGHFFIKKGDSKSEIYLHVDIAPLGYLSIAAHGHADALSFFLNIDGSPYIVDPGTYTYHTYPNWRDYFKGTIAHNTIRVDRKNQATNGGPCLWVDHYTAKPLSIVEDEVAMKITGSHSGYEKLGVSHTRSYTFNKAEDCITIIDEITAEDDQVHFYELPLHLHPHIKVAKSAQHTYEIYYPGKRMVHIALDEKLSSSIITGSEQPLLGWYSDSFLQKQPTSVIYNTFEIKGSFKLKTEMFVRSNTAKV